MDTAVANPHKTRARLAVERFRRLLAPLPRINRLFVAVVLAPTLLATLYFGFIAHDVYVSESQFVVRNMQRQPSMGGIGSVLQGVGFSQSGDDVYGVQAFVTSRDALRGLDDRFHLKDSFGSQDVDWIRRFDALGWDHSFENLLKYYQDFVVTTSLDTTSSILTLTVRAFNADDAYRVNEGLLDMSEDFVNRLNERARKDLLKFATADVDNAEQAVKVASASLSNYRDKTSIYDPGKQSDLQLKQVDALQEELIATRKQIADLHAFAKDNPQMPILENRLKVLRSEIDAEMAKVAGSRTSFSSQSPQYETITLERDFAAKRLDIALAALETARGTAISQQLYIERIEEPGKPDTAIEPRRIRGVLTILMLGMILWGILSLLITAVREHTD